MCIRDSLNGINPSIIQKKVIPDIRIKDLDVEEIFSNVNNNSSINYSSLFDMKILFDSSVSAINRVGLISIDNIESNL